MTRRTYSAFAAWLVESVHLGITTISGWDTTLIMAPTGLGRSDRQMSLRNTAKRSCESPGNLAALFSMCCIVQRMLTNAARLDVMHRLGRAMADPTRSRILLTLLEGPEYPAVLARDLDLTRSNVSNHLACLRDCGIVVGQHQGRQTRYEIADPHLAQALTALVETTLAVDVAAPCIDPVCTVTGCAGDEELSA